MVKPLGGRGKKAPYESSVLRVPNPLLPEFEERIERYRTFVVNGDISKNSQTENEMSKYPISFEKAKEEANKILRSHDGVFNKIVNLLQVIYGEEILEGEIVNPRSKK